jgi:glycosyltransferase involved in cell wall biosynthesis
MRILQILHDDERGGVQTLAGLIESGLLPSAFSFETAYLYPRPGLGLPEWSKLGHALVMARRIWRGDYDALIAYQSTASILVGVIGWLAGCRLRIVHQTCMPAETALPIRLIDRLVGSLGLYSVNITNSAATWAEFAHYPRPYRRSMILIEHGLDAPAPGRTREQARRRFNLPSSEPIILNVARLCPQKNQELLIRVLACLPRTHLVLAGGGGKSGALRALAAALGVSDRLHMLGPLPAADIADLYLAADLFLFPSLWETFGLAVVEAAMVGVPMVVADLPVLRGVLRVDGSEPVGYVAPHDTEAWISATRAALAAPPPLQFVAAFAREMRRKYARERMIENYLGLLGTQPSRRRVNAQRQRLPAPAEEIQS